MLPVSHVMIGEHLRDRAAPSLGPPQMRWKKRLSIAQGLIDLALREVARLLQAGAREIGSAEFRSCEIGAVEKRLAQIRSAQIGAVEPCIAEICIRQIRHLEISPGERGEAQRGVPQPGEGEIDGSAADRPHLPLAGAERDAGQVRSDGRILRAPLVPQPRAAAQRFDMIGISGQRYARNEVRTQLTRTLPHVQKDKQNATKDPL